MTHDTATQPRLSRAKIIDATLEIIDGDGLEAVTMRRIAEELGVQAPSLYNHMRSKDELLDAVAESVMESVDTSVFARLEWRAAIEGWAWSYYEALSAHPNLVPHLAVSFGRLDTALARADQVFAGLRDAGWTPSRATRIAAGVRYAVYGAALASFAGGFAPEARRYPNLGDIDRLRSDALRVDRAAFKLLIGRFLDGLESMAPAAPAR
ncbi:MAG: TetR/AcrR family transcriptional regulator [Solirubrobacterales bacterium]